MHCHIYMASPAQTPIEEFTPTPAFPALQYLESVDEGGVAWRAGLRMGDFLIEVLPWFTTALWVGIKSTDRFSVEVSELKSNHTRQRSPKCGIKKVSSTFLAESSKSNLFCSKLLFYETLLTPGSRYAPKIYILFSGLRPHLPPNFI